jgi:hypothetical protein
MRFAPLWGFMRPIEVTRESVAASILGSRSECIRPEANLGHDQRDFGISSGLLASYQPNYQKATISRHLSGNFALLPQVFSIIERSCSHQ